MKTNTEIPAREVWAFGTTHWSAVLAAGEKESPRHKEALSELCQTYWRPLYAYLRRRGYDESQAKDLTQDFFARLLEKGVLGRVTEEGGKFRSFLLTSLNHFIANERSRAQAQKRGGGCQILPLQNEELEVLYEAGGADGRSPDLVFERRWAATLLEQVMRRLERDPLGGKHSGAFEQVKCLLSGSPRVPYAVLAAKLEMSEGALKMAAHRLRKRYGELLREEVARTVSGPEEVEEEIRYLRRVFSQ